RRRTAMATIARIPITNVFMGGAYTARLRVGPGRQPVNVLLDTGSSALALCGRKYRPSLADGEEETRLAQSESYGDGSWWTGAVLKTTVSIGAGASRVVASGVSVAVAYGESPDMFDGCDGILGLAYEELDDAYLMRGGTWTRQYPTATVANGRPRSVVPYLMQLADDDVLAQKVSFLTRRSFIHSGAGLSRDPLNRGWMVIGGGEEATDLYTGRFQVVKVLTEAWYSTNLKRVIVGGKPPIHVRPRGPKGMPSNSIVDSGTNSLRLGKSLFRQILSKLTTEQAALLNAAVVDGQAVPMESLRLASWPTIHVVLEGRETDVTLEVAPGDYWQVNAPRVGRAMAAISIGEDGFATLGLPLMNGYFTIFDGVADGGKGVIKFARARR
ncbi:MAG: pepsin-like aspartic protease, partial [Burkholderiaceae bacterium]